MPDNELIIKILGRADTKDIDKTIDSLGKLNSVAKTLGVSLVAAGAAVTGAMTLAVKSFADAGSQIHDLAAQTGMSTESLSEWKYAAEQSGSSLDTVSFAVKTLSGVVTDANNGVQAAQEKLGQLGIKADELRGKSPDEIFNRITKAVAGVSDPMTRSALAVDIFGRSGNQLLPMLSEGEEGLEALKQEARDLGIVFSDEAADQADKLGDSFKAMGEGVKGLSNTIASALAPVIQPIADKIISVTKAVQAWAAEHPKLVQTLTILAGALGLTALALGGLILGIPGLIAGWTALSLAFTASPLGWVVVGIMAVVTAGVLLWQNWDKVASFFVGAWNNIRIAVLTGIANILEGLSRFTSWIPGFGDAVQKASDAVNKMIDSAKVGEEVRQIEERARGMVDSIRESLEKQKEAKLKALAAESDAAKRQHDDAIKALREEYGVIQTTHRNKMDMARDETEASRKAYDLEIKNAQKAHDEKISLLEKEYDEKIRTLNAETDYAVQQIQEQIDAIDRQTDQEDRVLREQERKNRLAELKAAVDSAATAEDKARAKTELEKYVTQVARERLLEQRADEKSALRQRIEELRNSAEQEKERLDNELLKNTETQKGILTDLVTNLETRKNALDIELEQKLARLEAERLDFEDKENKKLLATQENIKLREEASKLFYEGQLTEVNLHAAAVQKALSAIPDETVYINIVERRTGETVGLPGGASGHAGTVSSVPGLADGGIVTRPTLALIGESGREAIVPLDRGGIGGNSVVINFTQPVFLSRESDMQKLASILRNYLRRADRYDLGSA